MRTIQVEVDLSITKLIMDPVDECIRDIVKIETDLHVEVILMDGGYRFLRNSISEAIEQKMHR